MKFTTEKIETIRDMLYLPCKIISGDVPFVFSENGISVQAMDQSHICLVICDIPANMFTKIEGKEEREFVLNSLDFLKLLAKIKKSDNASLEIKDNKLIIKQMIGKRSSRWSLNIIDPEMDIDPIPIKDVIEVDHSTKMQLDISYIKEAISNLEIYDTLSATFTTTKKGLVISSGATNIGDYELSVDKDEMTEFESTVDSEAIFSTEYLKQICEIEKLSKQITLEYSNEAFMLIKSISDDFKMWIMLAAKTEDDLDDEEDEE